MNILKLATIISFLTVLFIVQPTLAQTSDLQILGSYETTYRNNGTYANRASNIRRAVEILSTAAIEIGPGETFSFNESVGRRTRSRGFLEAPVIIDGTMTEGYGGGVCQVASTIYAAAMYSGLTVVEHWRHSRTSYYIPPGLDATVDWGSKDLVLQNPFNYPVYLFIRTRPGDTEREEIVVVDFRATERTHVVSVSLEETRRTRFRTIIRRDLSLAPGYREVLERGTPGVRVVVRRTISPIDISFSFATDEERELVYSASARIILLGPPRETIP